MPDYASQISAIIGTAPADLVNYYAAGDFPVYRGCRIHCLPFESAKEFTQTMRGISVVDRLGLWVLDDANDSNPFAFISAGPCSGMIVHFYHDDSPEMAFSSLKEFVATMHEAGARGIGIDDIVGETIERVLDETIRELAVENSEDATFLLTLYLPIAAGLQNETMLVLASHVDFFVREAFAEFLARRPTIECEEIAERLAADKYPQVALPALVAVAAIKRKRQES